MKTKFTIILLIVFIIQSSQSLASSFQTTTWGHSNPSGHIIGQNYIIGQRGGICSVSWYCTDYAICNLTDYKTCLNVSDANTCGESFSGSLTSYVGYCAYCEENSELSICRQGGQVTNETDENNDTSITIGLGILALLFFIISFKLDESHQIIKILCFVCGILIILLISHHLLNTENYCRSVVANQTVSGNTTSYDYKRECFDYDKSTGDILFRLMGRVLKILQYYIMMFVLYFALNYFGVIDKIKTMFKK